MSGRGILNIETAFAAAALLILLWRARSVTLAAPRFVLETGDWWRMTVVALLSVAVFWRAAHNYFLSDDFVLADMARAFMASPAGGKYTVMFTRGGGDGFFRPLGYVSLFWTWPWAGFDAARWHWVGLSLHVVNALLVYLLAAAIGLSRGAAWLASSLFALQGSHPEAAVWIAGRFDLLAAMFVLVAMLAFVRLWERPSVAAAVIAAGAMVLGMLSKEAAYAAPLMMLACAVSRPSDWSRRVRFTAPFFLLAACLFAYRWALQGGIGGYVTAQGTPQIFDLGVGSALKAVLLRMWAILFFPVNWAAGAPAWLEILMLLCAAAWLAVVFTTQARRTALLGLALALAAALPAVQQLLIGPDLQKSRLLYLPSVGFCLFAAAAIASAAPKLRILAGAVIIAFSGAALLHNLNAWQNTSAKARTVCEAAASCSNPQAIRGLPGSLNGVYFFANGLPECVRLEQARHPGEPQHTCSLNWDERTGELSGY